MNEGWPMNADRGITTTRNRSVLLITILLLLGGYGTPTARASRLIAAKVQIEGNLATALDTYKVIVGRYPTTEQGLQILTTPLLQNADGRKWPAIPKIPPDPWGHAYQYVCPGVHNPDSYDLCSYGPDGRPGGGDDLANWEPEDVPDNSNRLTRAGFFAIVMACGVALTGILLFALHRRAEKRIALHNEGAMDK
jgi:general secretion pathway protein G